MRERRLDRENHLPVTVTEPFVGDSDSICKAYQLGLGCFQFANWGDGKPFWTMIRRETDVSALVLAN